MSLKILGAGVSPFVRKARVVCIEKSLDYTLEVVSPFNPPPDWRKISPLGKIPVLDHDGKIVNDSSAICAYLERIAPKPALYPSEPYDYARALWLEEFADGALFPVIAPKMFMPMVLRPILSGNPASAEDAESAAKAMQEEVVPLLSYLEEQLADREYFVGDQPSIADISIASVLVNMRHAGFAVDAAQLPKLAAFTQRIHARPSFARCIEEEKPMFGKRWV